MIMPAPPPILKKKRARRKFLPKSDFFIKKMLQVGDKLRQ